MIRNRSSRQWESIFPSWLFPSFCALASCSFRSVRAKRSPSSPPLRFLTLAASSQTVVSCGVVMGLIMLVVFESDDGDSGEEGRGWWSVVAGRGRDGGGGPSERAIKERTVASKRSGAKAVTTSSQEHSDACNRQTERCQRSTQNMRVVFVFNVDTNAKSPKLN